jgi:hypothetical protein
MTVTGVNPFHFLFPVLESREILTLPYLNCKVKGRDQIH